MSALMPQAPAQLPRQAQRRSGWSAPRWFPEACWQSQLVAPPRTLRPWLLDQGSLTAKLVAHSDGDFRVRVLRQAVARPLLSEQRLLGIPAGRQALVREVLLLGRGQPWVFARSLVPLTSLAGRLRCLRYLRDRPLGAFLFAQPDLQRGGLEISRIQPSQGYVPAELSAGEPLWGRRSVFRLDNKPLLVSEVFLPHFTRTLSL
ncbi:chorismate lyase [Marinimicrobium sp. ABcell2]|uniref:chorismate--pyruvate lyase family protein n=1 Tax=Marinimicrobium sp. ABcell2 TaxID=3069751 RepID=UPI0027B170E9|nr:chorismate lyase [Marinimicrobium sp. ABcell2]MDQ2076678.1 chorismate lyase [Marinimicrobium sp. ABcell2]